METLIGLVVIAVVLGAGFGLFWLFRLYWRKTAASAEIGRQKMEERRREDERSRPASTVTAAPVVVKSSNGVVVACLVILILLVIVGMVACATAEIYLVPA